MTIQLSRRDFLKSAAASTVVLVVGLNSKGLLAAGQPDTVINPFVRIDQDGFITVIAKHFEMGQGTTTGLATVGCRRARRRLADGQGRFRAGRRGKI